LGEPDLGIHRSRGTPATRDSGIPRYTRAPGINQAPVRTPRVHPGLGDMRGPAEPGYAWVYRTLRRLQVYAGTCVELYTPARRPVIRVLRQGRHAEKTADAWCRNRLHPQTHQKRRGFAPRPPISTMSSQTRPYRGDTRCKSRLGPDRGRVPDRARSSGTGSQQAGPMKVCMFGCCTSKPTSSPSLPHGFVRELMPSASGRAAVGASGIGPRLTGKSSTPFPLNQDRGFHSLGRSA
jgi:hypothetical protein